MDFGARRTGEIDDGSLPVPESCVRVYLGRAMLEGLLLLYAGAEDCLGGGESGGDSLPFAGRGTAGGRRQAKIGVLLEEGGAELLLARKTPSLVLHAFPASRGIPVLFAGRLRLESEPQIVPPQTGG